MNVPQYLCLQHLLEAQAERSPDATALLAPGRAPLTYDRLRAHVKYVGQTIHAMGLGCSDRVALVLPNGPEMAVAFLGVAASATCAPLNPAYSAHEFDFYLADLQAKALCIQLGMDSPARAVAHERGLRIIELSPTLEAEAGLFTLTGEEPLRTTPHRFALPDDVALVLHTAGTASRPKIVPLTHTNICTAAHHVRMAFELVESDRCLSVLPLFHAHALLMALCTSLMAGASVVCTPGFYAPQFFAWLAAFRPTWYTAVPTIHQAILARAALHREIIVRCPLRFIRSGSAALPPQLLVELERALHAPVIEIYGMTETSGQVTGNPLPPRQRKLGSVGVTIGPEVAIMDEEGTILPAGETGEVVVRGASVMQGYDNDPAANRRVFTHGWFRTGDQGYLDAEGYLFVTGRFKEIINRGGQKIAPREVEEVLMAHPAVAQAVAFAVPHTRLGEEVAAAVVLRQNTVATDRDIRAFAATRLAAFKVPRQVLIVEDIPQSPTGKLHHLGLAEKLGLTTPTQAQSVMSAGFEAPRTLVEELVAGLWAQGLDLERVSIHDDFFQMGGDSILATQLLSRVRAATGVEVSFFNFFETPTVSGMARSMEAASRTAIDPQAPPLQPVPRSGALPLSYAQQRLWFIEQLGLSGHAYNLLEVTRLNGPLHGVALVQSLQEIIRRHEVLRTTLANVEGQPFQVIGPAPLLSLPTVDLRELSEHEREAHVRTLAQVEVRRPFDLAQGPLLRATLLRLSEEEHVLFLTMHHIVSDGWSHGVFWQELALLYEAFVAERPSPLPELSIQYADFAYWQQQWLQGEVLEEQLAYWKQQLADVPTLHMPTDRPRPAVRTSRGARHGVALFPAITQALKALSQRHEVTLFMTLLAAFQALLYRYTAQDDVCVGALIANRNRIEIEGLIGFFVNTLVLRPDLSENPRFRELLGRVREVTLGAYSHQDLPFEKLLEELRPPRDLSCNPLFQILFNLQNTPRQAPEMAGMLLEVLEVDPETAKFDLALDLWETPDGLRGHFEYNTDLFDAATIDQMAGHFQRLLEGVLTDPEQRLLALPLLTESQRQQLSICSNLVHSDKPFIKFKKEDIRQSIPDRFAQQAKKYPRNMAIKTKNYEWTYDDLNRESNKIAHVILNISQKNEERIALIFEHDAQIIASILGVLKAGKIYILLDPFYPNERLAYFLEDSQASIVLTHSPHLALAQALVRDTCKIINIDAIESSECIDDIGLQVSPDSMAYILYTSGSTGQPKGVMQSHRNVLYFISTYTNSLHIDADDRLALLSTYSFDAAVMDIFGALLNGATLHLFDLRTEEFRQLVIWLQREGITIYHSTPTVYRHFVRVLTSAEHFPTLRLLVLGGEVVYKLDVDLYRQHFSPGCLFVNGLGPTESTLALQYFIDKHTEIRRHTVPVGYPVEGMEILVLSDVGEVVEGYGLGEIVIRSPHIALGYWRQPELTGVVFRADPVSGNKRMYYTGDLGRWLPDGSLEFAGRKDWQVKVRGYRIELGEVETTLEQHPSVRQVVVVAREDGPGDTCLVAYCVATEEPIPTVSALRTFLQAKLPDYMIPSTFMWLDTMPLTPGGKIDRRALPIPDRARPELEDAFAAPRTPWEMLLAEIWQEVLAVDQIGVYNNFFDLGGHSLLSMRVIASIEKRTGLRLNPRELIFQTLGQLASACAARVTLPQTPPPVRFTSKVWQALKRVFSRRAGENT